MNNFLSRAIREHQAFRIASATSSSRTKVSAIRQGEGKINNAYNSGAGYIEDGQDIMLCRFSGKNFVLGYSPFATSKTQVEIT